MGLRTNLHATIHDRPDAPLRAIDHLRGPNHQWRGTHHHGYERHRITEVLSASDHGPVSFSRQSPLGPVSQLIGIGFCVWRVLSAARVSIMRSVWAQMSESMPWPPGGLSRPRCPGRGCSPAIGHEDLRDSMFRISALHSCFTAVGRPDPNRTNGVFLLAIVRIMKHYTVLARPNPRPGAELTPPPLGSEIPDLGLPAAKGAVPPFSQLSAIDSQPP